MDVERDPLAVRQSFEQSVVLATSTLDKLMQSLEEMKTSKVAGNTDTLQTLVRKANLLFIDLRRHNRDVNLLAEECKTSTQEKKKVLDASNLQLQNLLYEKFNIQKEIEQCKLFKSKQQAVDLIPEDEFKARAPPELTSTTDQHRIMLNRFSFELQERERLRDELGKLKERRKSKAKTNAEREEFLASLQGLLRNLEQAAVPIQSKLTQAVEMPVVVHELAADLPSPLYILYCHFSAYGETLGGSALTTDIVRDSKRRAPTDPVPITGGNGERDAKRRRPETPNEGATGGNSGQGSVGSGAGGADGTQDGKNLYETSPLKVVVTLAIPDHQEPLQMTFAYLCNLHIITVSVPDAPTRHNLANLFPGDTGVETPNLANLSLNNATFTYDSNLDARPYRWAQYLGGLEFPVVEGDAVGDSSARRVQQTVSVVVRQLQQRVRAVRALQTQTSELTQSHTLAIPSTSPLFPQPASAKLTAFTALPVDSARYARDWRRFRLCKWQATVSRGKFTVVAEISITPEYPVRAPLFRLKTPGSNEHNNNLHDMETELNAHYQHLVTEETQHQLLSYQLRKLLQMVDICVDRASGTALGLGSALRDIRGRGRTYPLASKDRGVVDHR